MKFDAERVRAVLPGHRIEHLKLTISTMNVAADLAAEGAPHGTVVIADEQAGGQGRHGRSWHSEPGTGLYTSLLLRLAALDGIPLVTLALGLAAADAVQQATGVQADLRWPNDLLIGDRKLCGILVQSHHGCLVAGIGLNIGQESFPVGIDRIATSLRIVTGREFPREDLLIALVKEIDEYIDLLQEQGPDTILRLFTAASSYVSGRQVRVDLHDSTLEGVTDGLDAQGFLLVRDASGIRHTVYAGGVRPA